MFGLKSPLYLVYVRRKKFDLYDPALTPDAEPTAARGMFGLRYQPHHLAAGVFDNLRSAAEYANRLLGYRKELGVSERPFSVAALPDDVVEYRWPTGRHEFEAVGIMKVAKPTDGRPHQPSADDREAAELVAGVENPGAPFPLMLTQGGREAILGGSPLNRNWVMRDGVDWIKPIDADAQRYVDRSAKRNRSAT
jgi:hypothetical protein